LDITLDKKSNTEGHIKIKLIESDYQQKVDEKVKDYARKANIKGFRQGKVPPGVIRKLYGKSILVEEINHILSHALSDYIKENDLKLIGEPIPEIEQTKNIDWDTQNEFEFEYFVGLIDNFEYDISNKLKVKRHNITVDNKVIDSTIEDIKKQYGTMENPEVSEEGDSLYGSLILGEKENDTVVDFNDIDKRSRKKFIGSKKDDVISFKLRTVFKDDVVLARLFSSTIDEAKDLDGEASFTVKNVNRSVPAEINQELFDKTFGKDTVKSEKEFKDKIKETIGDNYKRESDYLLDRDIRNTLVDKTKIEIPDEFLKRWIVFSNEGKVSTEDIEKEYDSYTNELKWSLITNKINEEEKIKVENEEVQEEAKNQIIAQFGGPAVAEQFAEQLDGIVGNFLNAENGQNYMRIFNQLKSEKTLASIREKISITEKKVSLDEFKKLAEAQK
jgi:trigger factor